MSDGASSNDGMAFPAVRDRTIGGLVVQSVDGRDVHAYLRVGKDYSTWMRDRIAQFGFIEGQDFVSYQDLSSPKPGSAKSRAQITIEYALTLDMGKELGMVDRSERGRTIRQYFLACERMARGLAKREADIDAIIDRRVEAALARKDLMVRRGQTAGQIYKGAGFPALKGMATWFGGRLKEMGCSMEGEVRAEMGGRTARLFDPDKSATWLRNGGRLQVKSKLDDRAGQGSLNLGDNVTPIRRPKPEPEARPGA